MYWIVMTLMTSKEFYIMAVVPAFHDKELVPGVLVVSRTSVVQEESRRKTA
jgi:hypothetical protein